jgi:hypothetical protein
MTRVRLAGVALIALLALGSSTAASARSGATRAHGQTVTVSGTVRDGSGHGWPLYATLTVDGVGGRLYFTNPFTGRYSMQLPSNATYQVHVSADYPGYQTASQTVVAGSSNVAQDFALPVDALACDALGYSAETPGTPQTFDDTTTPAGWSVVNNTAAGGWQFDDPRSRGNLTGGSGGFAIIDSDFFGIGNTEDTFLVSPVVDLTGIRAPVLSFDNDYHGLDSVGDVDVSIDGGATWTNVWEHTFDDVRGPSHFDIALPFAAHQPAVQVRFHYIGTWAWWWEVDNVVLGGRCAPDAGGIVVGNVLDAATGAGIDGATVTSEDDPADTATTVSTPDDPRLGDGFYWLFSSLTGKHYLTAAQSGYASHPKSATIAADTVTKVVFKLRP